MSHYKPYPAYKDSGVEWLGKVPEHWDVKQLKYLTSHIGSGKTPSGGAEVYQDSGVLFLRSQNVHDDGLRLDDAVFISEFIDQEMAGSRVREHDVLLNITGASIGRSCLVPAAFQSANVNQHVCILRAIKLFSAKWLSLCLPSHSIQAQIYFLQSGAGREGLNFEQIGNMYVAIPSGDEAAAIADAIDRETARIDALITKKTRFIELLREKRQALITHAVTKGLDPNVKMKDSGVEWLGEVPEHWGVSKLKHNLREQLSYGANEAAEQDDPENPRFIRITDLNDDGTLRSETFKSLPWDAARPYLLEDGDVLLARSGATVGKSFLYKKIMGLACYAGYLIRARFDKNKILPRYFWYITNSSYYWDFISGSNIQSTIQNVSGEKYGNLWIATPPLKEQERVIIDLDSVWTRIQSIIDRTEKSIELLKERRSALITAAVTGQIDLREAA